MSDERRVWERCWCWQYGRCLVDCPTADVPPPRPLYGELWKRSALRLMRGIGEVVRDDR